MIDHSSHAHPKTKAARALCRAGGGSSTKDGTAKKTAPPTKKAVKRTSVAPKKALPKKGVIAKKVARKKATSARGDSSAEFDTLNAIPLSQQTAKQRARIKVLANRPENTGSRPAKKAAPAARGPASSPRVDGTDQTSWVTANALHLNDAMAEAHPATDGGLAEIARRQGWLAPARVTDRAGVDAAVAAGATVIWRGVRPSPARRGGFPARTQAELLDDMRSGSDWAHGRGIYGNGAYFSGGPATAEEFAEEEEDELVGTVRGAINPEARIVEREELNTEWREWMEDFITDNKSLLAQNVGSSPEVDQAYQMRNLMSDPGRFAAMMGYDVIHIEEGVDDGGDDSAQYIVLNRTVLILEDEP